MPSEVSRVYESGPLPALLHRELDMLAPILDGVFGVWGLHLRPHSEAPVTLPPHLLSAMVHLARDGDGAFAGDTRCEGQRLPFASESFKLVIAQHVLEQSPAAAELAEEMTRVLAPEGVALLFGFNPASLWRPWLSRRIGSDWSFRAASGWAAVLARYRLDVLQVRYSGIFSPWAAASDGISAPWPRALGRFGGSWLLLARKRRTALTPLRLGTLRSDLKLKPSLIPGAQRECA